MNDILLEEYINSYRFSLTNPNTDSSLYDKILKSLLNGKSEKVTHNLKVVDCYSLNKFPCVFSGTNQDYIIYDRYIERINKIFNYLYEYGITSETDSYVDKLIYGLTAEQCLIANDKIGFIYSSLRFNSIDSELNPITKNDEFIDTLQTHFIVLHEYGHFLLKQITMPDDYSSIIELIEEIQKEMLKIFTCKEHDKIISFIKDLSSDKNFIEECFCDSFAMSFIFKYILDECTEEEKLFAIKAIFYQLLTVHILSSMEPNQDTTTMTKSEIKSYARRISLKYISESFISAELSDELIEVFNTMHNIETHFCDNYFEKLYIFQDEILNIKKSNLPYNLNYTYFSDLYGGL